MKSYPVSFEIAGHAAAFSRPDSGATFVTYVAPTYSAAKGMFDCVARWKSAYIQPVRVEICTPIQLQQYATNYGGPLRKRNQVTKDDPYQLYATILVDVCYKVYGTVAEATSSPHGTNHLHALQELFARRLGQGRFYQTPCLGWSEFTPSYFGPLRANTHAREDINLTIPSMLHRVFDRDSAGKYEPTFNQNVRVDKGVLTFAQ